LSSRFFCERCESYAALAKQRSQARGVADCPSKDEAISSN
jgi:hypothetical protein